MKVCIVSFSSRKNGNCSQIGEFISSHLTDTELKLYSFADFTLKACGNCEYQCFSGGVNCPYSQDNEREILDTITNSDLTYFVVPNYCDFPSSNFFVFNERSLCYFQNNEELLAKYLAVRKKFIVVSNTNIANFQMAFAYHTNVQPEILCLSAKKYGKVSIDGNLLTAKQAINDLVKFITE